MRRRRRQLRAASQDPTDLVRDSAYVGWFSMWELYYLAKTIKGPVTNASMLKAARAATSKHPVDVMGYKWAPGGKGPLAFPNAPSGLTYMMQPKDGAYKMLTSKPFDMWKLLGIARS